MKKGKMRLAAMFMSLCMVLSLVAGVTANASWYNPDDDWDNGNEVQYGLFANRSWFGEYWEAVEPEEGEELEEGEEPKQVRKEGWLVEGDMPYSSEKVDISNMWDNTDVDYREIDGTYNQTFYFCYIPFTRGTNDVITVSEGVEPEVVKDPSKLVINYLGTELENDEGSEWNTDPRDAWDTITDTEAHLEAVGDDGLFKICDAEPGYYIISYGELTKTARGKFTNSDAAVGLRVYTYNGLAVREAWYDENEDNWYVNDGENYRNNVGADLWYKEFSLTNVNDGVEEDLSLDDVTLTYYGEQSDFPKDDNNNPCDPRWTYNDDKGTEDDSDDEEKYIPSIDTTATLTMDENSGLVKFTPDKPGVYLISKKGITNAVTDANREIREQAVEINVNSDAAGFFKEPGVLSHTNLLTTVWDNCYRPNFVEGQENAIEAYFYAPVAYENDTPVDTFEVCNIEYANSKYEVRWSKESEEAEAVLSIPDELNEIFTMVPVNDNLGWYKVTVSNLQNYFNAQFNSNYDNGREANLNIGYFESGQYYIKRLHEGDYQYPEDWGGYYGQVTEPYIFKLYKTDENGFTEVSSADMKKFSIYRYMEMGFINDNDQFEYYGWLYDQDDRTEDPFPMLWDDENDKWIESKDQPADKSKYLYYPDSTNPTAVLWIMPANESEIGYAATYGESTNGYMVINTSEVDRYALFDGTNIVKFNFDCPGIGLYSAPYRGVNENNENESDVVDDLILEDKVYQGRSQNDYVLTWAGDDGWSPIVTTMEAYAASNINWDNNTFDEFEGYVELDKGNAVKDSDNNIIGYPITITDKVEESFDLFMVANRKQTIDENGQTVFDENMNNNYERNTVFVKFIPLKELNIKTKPTDTYYEDAVFDATGMVVEAVYEDGEKFTLDAEDYDIAIGEKQVDAKLATTDTKVTISYLGETVDIPITVNAKTPINLSELTWNYEQAFTYDGEAKKVEISGLPDTVNVEYTNNEKTEVGKYTAEATITLKDATAYKFDPEIPDILKSLEWEIKEDPKTVADKAAADAVADMFNALPATVTVADEAKIKEAKDAYTALTADQKALISDDTLNKLTVAETSLAAAKAAAEEAAKKAAEEEAAKKAAEEAAAKKAADEAAAKKAADEAAAKAAAEAAADEAAAKAAAEAAAKNIGKTKISVAKNNKGKKILIKVKAVSGATGYEVRYSLKKSMKSAKTKKLTGKTSVTLTKLKKKTYYIQARTYATYDGKTYYSKWTAKKKVKVKK